MKIIPILLLLLLSGCAGMITGFGDTSRGFVDGIIARGGKVMDATLNRLEEIERQAKIEAKRSAKAKCFLPFVSLKRYALSSDDRKKAVEEDCGLRVNAGGDITLKEKTPTN